MNDIRRTILWVIFGFSMVMLWDQWQIYNGNKPTFGFGQPKPTATAPAPAGGASGVPSSTVPARRCYRGWTTVRQHRARRRAAGHGRRPRPSARRSPSPRTCCA